MPTSVRASKIRAAAGCGSVIKQDIGGLETTKCKPDRYVSMAANKACTELRA